GGGGGGGAGGGGGGGGASPQTVSLERPPHPPSLRSGTLSPQAGRGTTWRGLVASHGIDLPILLAGLFFAGDLFFWHLAILGTTVANATFLATTTPIIVAFGAWMFLSEAVGGRTLIGFALCLLGGVALVGERYGFKPQRLMGD